jgi:glutaredoxin
VYFIIGKDGCDYCDATKALLDKRHAAYVYKNLSKVLKEEREKWTDLIKNELGCTTVPVVIDLVGGYEELKERVRNG